MKRMLLVAAVCVLIVSTAGVTTVSATQIGHSPIYYFDITNNGKVVGKVVINTANAKIPTYVLVANGLTPNTKYTFGYTASGVVHTLSSADATKAGALVMHGTFPAAGVKDVQSAQFWVTETPASGAYYAPLCGFVLYNYGGFLAKLACDYSTDGGVTWHESGHTKGIVILTYGAAVLGDLGVPGGALVKIHAIVVGGVGGAKAKTGSEVFQYYYTPGLESYHYAEYYISGTTFKNKLEYEGYY